MYSTEETNELLEQIVENLSDLKVLQREAILINSRWFEEYDDWYPPDADPAEDEGYDLDTAYRLLKMKQDKPQTRKSEFQQWSENQPS